MKTVDVTVGEKAKIGAQAGAYLGATAGMFFVPVRLYSSFPKTLAMTALGAFRNASRGAAIGAGIGAVAAQAMRNKVTVRESKTSGGKLDTKIFAPGSLVMASYGAYLLGGKYAPGAVAKAAGLGSDLARKLRILTKGRHLRVVK
jgi:hypothetical protein